ncbi:hypothetical protein [Compostibacter hankyongensis]|uniref:DUF2892 domain-containing protein n=1 Tax=Compostibacter hankyongensis TaxID=1007089 RepID=A0ABP8FWS5_9BACT
MKERILYGWNIRRSLYFLVGVGIAVYAVLERQWLGAILGAYFAAMALFNFGCAAGNCSYTPGRRE